MVAATIAVLATLDTKADEAVELARLITRGGARPRIVDVGLRSRPRGLADVTSEEVARRAGTTPEALLARGRRDAAITAMGEGAGRLLAEWHAAGRLAAVIALGGNQGSAIAAIALRELPLGLPKLIVSTVASGDVRRYVAAADVAMLFSIGDLLGGPNRVTRPVLRAAAAIVGMARQAPTTELPQGPAVAITAFGNTHAATTLAIDRLRAAGWEPVPFHASGACGSAMERLIDEGVIDAVLDLTTHELLAELYPFDAYAPVRPGRLTAAGRRGIPHVVAPGGLEYFCLGGPETVPEWLRRRPTHWHNPYNLNVRAGAEELARTGAEMARRLNAARGPLAVLIPARGWSEVGSPGGVLNDPKANAAFVAALRDGLRADIPLRELDATINDPAFADAAVDALLELSVGHRPARAATALTPASTRGGSP